MCEREKKVSISRLRLAFDSVTFFFGRGFFYFGVDIPIDQNAVVVPVGQVKCFSAI